MKRLDPELRSVMLAAHWAQPIGLPAGNKWEQAISRHALAEWHKLGGTEQAWALTEALMCGRLGIEVRP